MCSHTAETVGQLSPSTRVKTVSADPVEKRVVTQEQSLPTSSATVRERPVTLLQLRGGTGDTPPCSFIPVCVR